MTDFEKRMAELIDEIHDIVFADKERLEKDTEYLKKASDAIISISDKLYWLRVEYEIAKREARVIVLEALRDTCKSVGVEYLRLEDIDDLIEKEVRGCDTFTE